MKIIRQIVKRNVNFYVNEEGKTITAVIERPDLVLRDIAIFINAQCKIDVSRWQDPSKFKKISETVICSEEDEWNEEYGKRLAFNKLYSRQFKSIMNNYLSKKQAKLANASDLICRILGIQTDSEFMDEFEEFLKDLTEENTELRARVKNLSEYEE